MAVLRLTTAAISLLCKPLASPLRMLSSIALKRTRRIGIANLWWIYREKASEILPLRHVRFPILPAESFRWDNTISGLEFSLPCSNEQALVASIAGNSRKRSPCV